jgi:dipeptidyl aminopeptidase/acylaminoacyl peptidase
MARSLKRSAPETASYHGEIWTDARGYATVRLPAGAGRLLPPLEYEPRDLEALSSVRLSAELRGGRFAIETDEPHVNVARADRGPQATTSRGGRTMNKLFAAAVVVAATASVALAAASGPAHATYPGATNGRIAFGINIGGNTDVYTVRPDGQALRRLTTDPGFDACAAYSADGRRIAYCSGQGGGPVQVWTMKQNGTDKQQVTHMSGVAIFPDYSPDGSEIVFAAQPAGATARNIYVVPSDGGTPQQLTTVGNNVYPAFSPDGSKIVFTSNRTGTSQVYVMNADGSGQTQLTFDPQPKDQVPDWSPDGSKIAYLADTHGIPDVTQSWGDIWVMNADGSGQHPITNAASWYGTAWSPDGTRIATMDMPSRTIYTLNARDGSDAQAVHAGGLQFVPGWQPRGTGGGEEDDG